MKTVKYCGLKTADNLFLLIKYFCSNLVRDPEPKKDNMFSHVVFCLVELLLFLGFERSGTLRSRDVWKVACGKFPAAPGVESLPLNYAIIIL